MPATGDGGRPPPETSCERLFVPFCDTASLYLTLYTRAVPRFETHPGTAGTGVCVLNVVVPKTVIADVTTCSCATMPRYQPFFPARSAAVGFAFVRIGVKESRHIRLALQR